MSRPCRILLVDDHPVFLHHAARFLNAQEGMLVTGTARSAAEGVRRARDLEPDVVLIDIFMPGGSGLDVISDLKALVPAPKVIMLSSQSSAYAERARSLGADASINKEDMVDAVARTIRGLTGGHVAAG